MSYVGHMTQTTQDNAAKALAGLRCGDRSVAEVAKHAGMTDADAQVALDALAASDRAVATANGYYLPYRPDLGDTIHYIDGRVVGVRAGRR